jgi:hypothetical protein
MARPFLLFGVKRPQAQSEFHARKRKPLIRLEKLRNSGKPAFVAEQK